MATYTGTSGNDTQSGTSGDDIFNYGQGGDDTLSGLGGDDQFHMGAAFTAADAIDGGGGTDTLFLNGDYSAGVVFAATTLINVEKIFLSGLHSYSLTTDDATVAAGHTLTVDGSGLQAGDTLIFNGGAETDGHFDLTGGAGDDTLIGGAQHDWIDGGGGADTLTGGGAAGGGIDHFIFRAASDSTGTHYDTITDLAFAQDNLVLPTATGAITAIDAALTAGALDSGANFDTELTAALSSHLGAHHAILFTPDSGSLSGQTFLVVDLNGHAGYQSGADLVIDVTGYTGTPTTADFT